MEINTKDGKAKVIAYYLPQFYPCEFNNKWYGKGFTEWINVGKAKPLYPGHYQPQIPGELGYYDLRVPEVAERQVELAKEAGIAGFAYWHYWFGNGRKLLEMPSERMLNTGKPDFPFFFAWDNSNWFKKKWDIKKGKDVLIMDMAYPGDQDEKDHFNYCLQFFKDERYIRYDGCPLFLIYNPLDMPDVTAFMQHWNQLLKDSGAGEKFCFIGEAKNNSEYEKLKSKGIDIITFSRTTRVGVDTSRPLSYLKMKTIRGLYKFLHIKIPNLVSYNKVLKYGWNQELDSLEDVIPMIIPRWDHTPRSKGRDMVYTHVTPEKFGKAASIVLGGVEKKQNKLVVLKSWNEWGEGNYMEPDDKFGKAFINALGKLINK